MAAILEVRVLSHLVHVKDPARRHLLLGKFALGLAAGIVFQPLSQHRIGLYLHVMRQPVCDFTKVQIAEDVLLDRGLLVAHRAPDTVPQPIVAAANHHVTVLAWIDGVDIDRQIPVTVAWANTTVHGVPSPAVVQDSDDGLGGRSFDELALAGNVFSVQHRGKNAHGRRCSPHVVGHPQGGAGRLPTKLFRVAGTVDKAAGSLGHRVEHPRLVFQWAPLTALTDPAVNQSRIEFPQLASTNARSSSALCSPTRGVGTALPASQNYALDVRSFPGTEGNSLPGRKALRKPHPV